MSNYNLTEKYGYEIIRDAIGGPAIKSQLNKVK